jgi:hypothetical protein
MIIEKDFSVEQSKLFVIKREILFESSDDKKL